MIPNTFDLKRILGKEKEGEDSAHDATMHTKRVTQGDVKWEHRKT